MAEYREREKEYAATMAGQLGTFTTAIVEADGMAKDAAAERFFRVVERDNLDISAKMTLIGNDQPFTIGVNVPPVMVTKTGPIEIQEANLSLGMNVHAMQESSKDTDSKTEVSGRASIGWGMFKASLGLKSTVGVRSHQKRASDYSAHCDVDVKMGQSEPPEGQMIILDAFATCLKRNMDLNMALVEQQIQTASETAVPPPAPEAIEDNGNQQELGI